MSVNVGKTVALEKLYTGKEVMWIKGHVLKNGLRTIVSRLNEGCPMVKLHGSRGFDIPYSQGEILHGNSLTECEADFRTVAEFVYNAMGDMVERRTYTNATDYVTERFAYDHEGREIASTNSLGGVVTTSYDPRGNVTAVDGATYPLRMEYDLKGRRTSLKTTRDGERWDETRWTLDPATGLCLSKTYADHSTISYTYTPDGLPARTTWPGGRWQENGYNARREVVSTERSDGEETTFAYDVYSREIAVTNDSASIEFTRDERGRATNVTTTVAGTAHSLARDGLRRSLVTGIVNTFNGNAVESIAYSYDALGRPVARNNDAFGYNDRSEVTSASIMGWSPSPSTASYGYDGIGNLQLSSFNAATNAYTANSLNQYTAIQEISAPSAPLRVPTYDTDGNMLSDGVLSFTYDAASRLKTVSSNGVTLVTNFYDAKSRRVKKVTPNATTTFFYDDWNLVEERIAYADNTSSTIRYIWGKDLSGTLQGAGGVGGLLWLTVDGTIYIPCYDSNGNVTRYLNANGGTMARYSYDAFGKLIARAGRRASFFRHRFSTKYFDSETGLYYYGYRFYHPGLMRWLNRDPIEDVGGVNLFMACNNSLVASYDIYGCFVVEYYSLDSAKSRNKVTYTRLSTVNDIVVRNEMIKPSGDIAPMFASNHGAFLQHITYIDDCVVQIRVEINLNIELENKVQKGDLYVYWPHSTSIHSGYQGVTSTEAKSHRRPPKGSVLAHELGHAEVFVTMTKPRFENDISSYLSKNSLTSEEQNEVIDLFSQAKRDALGESYKRANANTVLWFQTHDFSVTRRRNGNLKPTVGDEYEFIKR